MIPEITTFLLLLVIFILGYGVASQALLNPHQQFSWAELPALLSNIIFLPYWQMYGELSLESVQHTNKVLQLVLLLVLGTSQSNISCMPNFKVVLRRRSATRGQCARTSLCTTW